MGQIELFNNLLYLKLSKQMINVELNHYWIALPAPRPLATAIEQ